MTYANRISASINGSPTNGVPDETHAMLSYGPAHALQPAAGVTTEDVYKDLDTFITAEDRTYWCFMRPTERPSFTRQLLTDLAAMQAHIGKLFAAAPTNERPFDYFVLGSRTPGVFNLGGDLVLFRQKIEQRDADTLRHYAYRCVESGYANYTGYGHRVITIALIQGDALGGGLESALSCDLLVAERQAKFGLPEILFNLFPGMGAYSFLSRKIGAAKAEEMIMSGRIYTAEEMHALGVVDILVDEGQGQAAVKQYIAGNRARHSAHSAIYQVRRRVNPVTLQELRDVTDTWVEAAMRLSEQDLRKMARIAAAQDRSRQRRMASMAVAAE